MLLITENPINSYIYSFGVFAINILLFINRFHFEFQIGLEKLVRQTSDNETILRKMIHCDYFKPNSILL